MPFRDLALPFIPTPVPIHNPIPEWGPHRARYSTGFLPLIHSRRGCRFM